MYSLEPPSSPKCFYYKHQITHVCERQFKHFLTSLVQLDFLVIQFLYRPDVFVEMEKRLDLSTYCVSG